MLAINNLGGVFDSPLKSKSIRETPGPDGGRGIIVSYDSDIAYKEDSQEWQKIHGANAWVGYNKSDRPTPKDLARDSSVSGYPVELGDGNQWVVPRARLADGITSLPRARAYKDGSWTKGDIIQKYQKLWETAEKFWSEFEKTINDLQRDNTEVISVEFPEENDCAVMALSANYRMGMTEVSILGLLTDETVGRILHALVDYETISLFEKKTAEWNQQENSSTDPGEQD